jgi:hypothetical protein
MRQKRVVHLINAQRVAPMSALAGIDPSTGPLRWSVREATKGLKEVDATALAIDGCVHNAGPNMRAAIEFLEAMADSLQEGDDYTNPATATDVGLDASSWAVQLAILAWYSVWVQARPGDVDDVTLCLEAAARLRDGWLPPHQLTWMVD